MRCYYLWPFWTIMPGILILSAEARQLKNNCCGYPGLTFTQFVFEEDHTCYCISTYQTTFQKAVEMCTSLGPVFSLVSAHDQAHNDFIARNIRHKESPAWLGLTHNTTSCGWLNGQKDNNEGRLSDMCEKLLSHNEFCPTVELDGCWKAVHCEDKLSFICERVYEVPVPDKALYSYSSAKRYTSDWLYLLMIIALTSFNVVFCHSL